MKGSAVSENKQGSRCSVLKKEGISRPVESGQDSRCSLLAGIIQRSGCNGRECSHSRSSLAKGVSEASGAQRKTIGNSLQRSLGNRFVQGLAAQRLQSGKEMTASGRNGILQAKLVIGPADDEYEREADRIAEQAVRTPETPVQRACPFCQEDEPVQREPLSARITPLIQRQETEEEDENGLQASPMIQRLIGEEEEEEKIQIAPEGTGLKGGPAGPGLEQSLEQAWGGGRPLSEGFRGRMESAFGADFSSVRIHADEPADRLSRSIQARAFTRGQDIFLRHGEYQPSSTEGQRLLAHELTHVVQQKELKCKENSTSIQRDNWDDAQHEKEFALSDQQNRRSDPGRLAGTHPVQIGAVRDRLNEAQTQGNERHIDDDMLAVLAIVLDSLPASHINGNPALGRIVLKHANGEVASSFSRLGNELTLIVPFDAASWVYLNITKWPLGDLATTLGTTNYQTGTLTRDIIGTGTNLNKLRMVPEKFVEWMIRHEIGHSVDEAIGWHANGHYRNPACGAWEIHADPDNMSNMILTAVGLADNLHELNNAFNPHNGVGYNELRNAIVTRNATDLTPDYRERALVTFEGNVPGGTRMVNYAESVVRRGLESPYENGGGVRLGNRTYHLDPQHEEWVSYQSDKYDRRDSNYQFQSPGEWFAETYSRYFIPPQDQWGQKVNDPAARDWFRHNLDPINNHDPALLLAGNGNLVKMPEGIAERPVAPVQQPAPPPSRIQEALSTLQSIGITIGTLPISAVTRVFGLGVGTVQLGKIGLQAAYRLIRNLP